jgi:hypothetical protein
MTSIHLAFGVSSDSRRSCCLKAKKKRWRHLPAVAGVEPRQPVDIKSGNYGNESNLALKMAN